MIGLVGRALALVAVLLLFNFKYVWWLICTTHIHRADTLPWRSLVSQSTIVLGGMNTKVIKPVINGIILTYNSLLICELSNYAASLTADVMLLTTLFTFIEVCFGKFSLLIFMARSFLGYEKFNVRLRY